MGANTKGRDSTEHGTECRKKAAETTTTPDHGRTPSVEKSSMTNTRWSWRFEDSADSSPARRTERGGDKHGEGGEEGAAASHNLKRGNGNKNKSRTLAVQLRRPVPHNDARALVAAAPVGLPGWGSGKNNSEGSW